PGADADHAVLAGATAAGPILEPEGPRASRQDAHGKAGDRAIPDHGLAGAGHRRTAHSGFGQLPGHDGHLLLKAHRRPRASAGSYGSIWSSMAGYADKTRGNDANEHHLAGAVWRGKGQSLPLTW